MECFRDINNTHIKMMSYYEGVENMYNMGLEYLFMMQTDEQGAQRPPYIPSTLEISTMREVMKKIIDNQIR